MEIDHPTVPPFDISLKLPLEDSFSSLSPDSLYSYSLEEYTNFANSSYNTDFSADSPLSLGSPVSPTTSGINPSTTVLGFDNTWAALEQPDVDDLAFVKPEPAESPLTFSAFPSAIDPVQLSGSISSSSPDEDLFALSVPNTHTATPTPTSTPAPSSLSTRRSNTMPSPRDRRSFSVRKPSSAAAQRKGSSGSSSSSSASLKRKSTGGPGSPLSPSLLQQQLQEQQQQQQSATSSSAYEPPKKTAHNLIEKRYRTNLNDKILALRDAVPALRVVARHADAGSEDEDDERHQQHQQQLARYGAGVGTVTGEDLGGLAPAHKLNKATILGKATEYIAHLERRNELLARENESLRGKVSDYEMFVMSRRM